MKGEIKRPESNVDMETAAPTETAGAEPVDSSEIERVVRELQSRLTEATEAAEDTIAAHPLTSIAAAFLLGIAVGRLTRRI
ncbi:MAG: hypothetical protein K8F62_08700 [Pseudorhodoplanes sp.]|nr:hypothetical protein [Pseudorhodoplanes sp.]